MRTKWTTFVATAALIASCACAPAYAAQPGFADTPDKPAPYEPSGGARASVAGVGSVDAPEPENETIEPHAVPEPLCEDAPQGYDATASWTIGDPDNFMAAGVVHGEDGTRYTWYSERALPGDGLDELNANGRHLDDAGYVRDADGYIAVASSDHEKGAVLDTPFGMAKVYDTGCESGTVDVYTGW